MSARAAAIGVLLAALGLATAASAQPFSYLPPGDLIDSSGQGRADDFVYAPGIRFPIAQAPAYANSQVYMAGGLYGPGGGQCDAMNYSYPWRDNYCEIRQWDMPLCPAGSGHQGQDIRGATCDNSVHDCVATVDGTITNVGNYSVYLTAADGTRYDYLHMSNVAVGVGQEVTRGDVLGRVSNVFGGTSTTIHLHFNLRQNVDGLGQVYVPPYTSLIASYLVLVDQPPEGELETVDCDTIEGWAFDVDTPSEPLTVTLGFSGGVVDENHNLSADLEREDLCTSLGSCEHALEAPSPLSLFDGEPYAVSASTVSGPAQATLVGSPGELSCDLPTIEGVRRPLSAAAQVTWKLSSFWDEPPVPSAEVEALALGPDVPAVPTLWRNADGALWLAEGTPADTVRAISEQAARAWRFDVDAAEARELDGEAIGTPLRPRPIMLRDAAGATYLLDDDPGDLGGFRLPHSTDHAIPGSNGGCACRASVPSDGAPSPLTLLLAAALVAWRRRR